MRKNIISVAAAMTVLTSGAFAFDTNGLNQLIVDEGSKTVVEGSYKQDVTPTVADLKVSTNQLGDALIYPVFNFSQADNLGTEIVVRNVKNVATVAKVALYAKSDSRELVDFNVYLSANDVFKFTINPDGTISTKDGSIMKIAANPMSKNDSKETVVNPHGSEYVIQNTKLDKDGKPVTSDLKVGEDAGYVIIYGMAQADKDYHGKHKELFLDYRSILDKTRDGWREAWTPGGLTKGIMTIKNKKVQSPNITDENTTLDPKKSAIKEKVAFTSPESDTFTGSVRVFGGKGDTARDMVLPATALENFTSEKHLVLWTEAEYAALQDRRIVGDANGVTYDADNVKEDSKAFLKSQVYYNFTNSTNKLAVNKLIFTQPYKRVLVQLDRPNFGGYWHATQQKDQVAPYGVFALNASIVNENEDTLEGQTFKPKYLPGFWTSPGTTDPGTVKTQNKYDWANEVQSIINLQDVYLDRVAADGAATSESIEKLRKAMGGYMFLQFADENGSEAKVPAIVTQMSSSVVDGKPLVNWVYAPTVK